MKFLSFGFAQGGSFALPVNTIVTVAQHSNVLIIGTVVGLSEKVPHSLQFSTEEQAVKAYDQIMNFISNRGEGINLLAFEGLVDYN